ncbi:GumC family protein [Mucilaginibacter celer]|uniref:non-specific protein-tyrosine kinase n=1 Tax=Mucilaginibacter celer TaxID=2305508 RepID=A0A494VUZ3_9SPHI|nr:tyrosine-protein kinase [Mucilaginibacter celer]AYL95253.1 polysaccharide biosynthesis tyrosine autokinase [Mucilaginibacter celer]
MYAKNLLLQLKNYWYFFILGLILFIGLAYVYNQFSTKQYLVSSTLLLQQQPNNNDASSAFANGGATSALNMDEVIKNEGDVLRSRTLMTEVVQKFHLNIRLLSGSGLTSTEIYDEAPFGINVINTKVDSVKRREYVVHLAANNKIHIENTDEGISRSVDFDQKVVLPQYDIVFARVAGKTMSSQEYSTQIVSEDDAVTTLLKSYDAEFTDKATTTVGLTFYYPNSKKGELILQALMTQYLADNIRNKKEVIDSTINFINTRLAVVGGELTDIEKNYQSYRSSNNITDIDEQSKLLVNNASDYNNRYEQQKIQLSIINSLKKRLNSPDNTQVIPSSLNIQTASFSASLAQYNDLLNQRAKQRLSYTETHPDIVNLDQQIHLARRNLLQSIDSYESEMQLSSSGIGRQNNILNNIIKGVPGKQRSIMDFSRQQDLKQQLYVYLLQKREETSMAKASSMPYSRIVDSAKSSKEPAKPIKPLIYLMSVFLGFLVPFGVINSKKMMQSRISSENDIEQFTDVTIIGKIGHQSYKTRSKSHLVLRSQVTESLRTLRTKLRNILEDKRSAVIMITSSVNGEGKTFLTRNLGNTLAMTGKRVVLVELDLRKPKLSQRLGVDNQVGFSNYVLDDVPIADIIKPGNIHENCFVVPSGPVMINAGELLLDDKLGYLIDRLRSEFDYVIIDSSPVGLVSDALVIQKYVDLTMYVCRHNYTNKAQIEIINEIKNKDNVDNLYLVINDVNFSKSGYFGYGYGVGYGS